MARKNVSRTKFISPRWVPVWLFGLFFSLYTLSMGGHGYGGVGTTTYDVTRSMFINRSFAIQRVPWGKVGRDGQFYAQYGIGHSLYNLPFYLLGHCVAATFPQLAAQYDRITMLTTLLGQPVITALTCVLLYLFCQKLGYPHNTSIWCSLFYGLGTQAWMYAQLDFSEPILTFWLLGSVYWLIIPRSHPQRLRLPSSWHLLLSGLCLGAAITVKIVAILALPVLSGYLSAIFPRNTRTIWKALAWFLMPVIGIGVGVVGWYNFIRFGSPFETGYGNEFTKYIPDILRHFTDNLFGLEGSIFFYSPVIVLAFAGIVCFYQQFPTTTFLLGGIILTFFGFYPFTTNELYYGPRYLTPILPYFLIIAGAAHATYSWRAKRIALFCLIMGIGQQLIGVVVNYHSYYWRIQYTLAFANAPGFTSEVEALLRSTPRLPHILGHLWLITHAVLDAFKPGGIPLSGIELLADATRQNAWLPYYGIDLWWYHPKLLELAGVILPAGIVVSMAGIMVFSFYRLFRISSEDISGVLSKER